MRGSPVKGSRILVLGVAYKKNVSDLPRVACAVDIIHLLEGKGGGGELSRSVCAFFRSSMRGWRW